MILFWSTVTGCRFSLLSLAALEATLQLELPMYSASVRSLYRSSSGQSDVSTDNQDSEGTPVGSSVYGEQVVFIANDWHAGPFQWFCYIQNIGQVKVFLI